MLYLITQEEVLQLRRYSEYLRTCKEALKRGLYLKSQTWCVQFSEAVSHKRICKLTIVANWPCKRIQITIRYCILQGVFRHMA